MDNNDFKLLFDNKFASIFRFKKFIDTLRSGIQEPLNSNESPPVENFISNQIDTEENKENTTSPFNKKEWPAIFLFPKERVSNTLQLILSQPDKELEPKDLKNLSILNELVKIVFDEIKQLNM